jgi:hypothetical protein
LAREKKDIECMIENGFLCSGSIAVRALRDIRVGEELLMDYDVVEQAYPDTRADDWILGGKLATFDDPATSFDSQSSASKRRRINREQSLSPPLIPAAVANLPSTSTNPLTTEVTPTGHVEMDIDKYQ